VGIPTSSENWKGNFVKYGGELKYGGKTQNHAFLCIIRHISETVRDRMLVTIDRLLKTTYPIRFFGYFYQMT